MVLSRDLQRRAQIAAGAVSSLEEVPMRAWVVDTPGPIDTGPLVRIHRPTPVPGRGQVLVRVTCCGVCRTDLHLAEGDLPPHRARTVPGHEVVGVVDAVGPGSHRFRVGDRIGVPWLARTDGSCPYCRRGDENLCSAPQFTGWDLDGGYADACVADEAYVYRLPDVARRRTRRASALCRDHRLPRAAPQRRRTRWPARHLRLRRQRPPHRAGRPAPRDAGPRSDPRPAEPGAGSTARRRLRRRCRRHAPGAAGRRHPLRARPASSCRRRCRRWTEAGRWPWPASGCPTSPTLGYDDTLFQERTLCSVTANTREDGEEFLALADRFAIRPDIVTYPMADAPRALSDLAHGRFSGAAVLCAD